MALNWNVAEITAREGDDYVWPEAGPDAASYDRVPGKRYLAGATECMIWATMFVGIGRITATNADEFAKRLRAWETIAGCISSSGKPIPAETVKRHIGLTTNASPIKPAAFAKKLAEIAQRNAAEAVARELRETVTSSTSSQEATE